MSNKPYILMVKIDGEYYVTQNDAAEIINENAKLKREFKSLRKRAANYIAAIRAEHKEDQRLNNKEGSQ